MNSVSPSSRNFLFKVQTREKTTIKNQYKLIKAYDGNRAQFLDLAFFKYISIHSKFKFNSLLNKLNSDRQILSQEFSFLRDSLSNIKACIRQVIKTLYIFEWNYAYYFFIKFEFEHTKCYVDKIQLQNKLNDELKQHYHYMLDLKTNKNELSILIILQYILSSRPAHAQITQLIHKLPWHIIQTVSNIVYSR